MLLSRVAADLYWAARYLERAEDTARIVREHTNLIVDFPIGTLGWEPLLAVTGTDRTGGSPHGSQTTDELSVVGGLVADEFNAASIISCIAAARTNVRSCREVVPREYWLTINDLHLYVEAHAAEGVDRRSRNAFLSRVIAETQRAVGILGGVMSSDDAYEMLRLGRTIERADMTTRVLDVRCVSLINSGDSLHADVQWGAVLRSLGALQMFNRTRPEPVSAGPVVDFLLHDRFFPRAVRCCLDKVASSMGRLPAVDAIPPAVAAALTATDTIGSTTAPGGDDGVAANHLTNGIDGMAGIDGIDGVALRIGLDAIQMRIAELSDCLTSAYFAPQ